MNNMMRGMTAMLLLAACAPAAAQTTPKTTPNTTPKAAAPTEFKKYVWQFGRATGDSIHFRLGNGGEGGFLGVEEPKSQQGAWSIGRFGFSDQADTIAVRTFALRYLDSEEAAKLVGPYVRSPGSAVYDGGPRVNAITVREQQSILTTIDSVLREFDRPPSTMVLHFQVLANSDAPTTDPAIADVDKALRGVFRYPGYRLVAEGTALVVDFSSFTVTMNGESVPLTITGTVGRVRLGAAPTVVIMVDLLSGPTRRMVADSVAPSRTAAYVSTTPQQLISSQITMPVGEAVVLGSGSIPNQKGTLILVVRPSLRPPLPR